MIDPKQLRIGNWVLVEIAKSLGETEVKYRSERVDSIFVDGINMEWDHEMSDYTHAEKVRPILLTPEILEKCGFEVYKDNPYWKNPNYVFYHLTIGYESFPIAIVDGEIVKYFACEDDEYSWFGRPIISLHQLQNLYFALTGEELNYSPE